VGLSHGRGGSRCLFGNFPKGYLRPNVKIQLGTFLRGFCVLWPLFVGQAIGERQISPFQFLEQK
jgi:hypothetical protein